jgi:hypothetical protein
VNIVKKICGACALGFMGLSYWAQHFGHDIPWATLMIGWACLMKICSQE